MTLSSHCTGGAATTGPDRAHAAAAQPAGEFGGGDRGGEGEGRPQQGLTELTPQLHSLQMSAGLTQHSRRKHWGGVLPSGDSRGRGGGLVRGMGEEGRALPAGGNSGGRREEGGTPTTARDRGGMGQGAQGPP